MRRKQTRKRYEASFKARVALAAVRADRTVSELASHFGIHGSLIAQWKRKLLTNAEQLFSEPSNGEKEDRSALIEELHKQVGQLHVELEWAKKKAVQFDR
jgi:transposase-like protein